ASPATTTTTTTPIINAQLNALIDQGVADALAARDADRIWNGDDSHNSRTGSKRTEQTARECTYTDFLKCQPMNFRGIEGVVGLTQWFERIKTDFNISKCAVENQVKFATCTLHGVSLTWWNLMSRHLVMMPLTELALLCGRMFPEESDKIEKYVGGLPDMIHGSVMASKPKTMHDAESRALISDYPELKNQNHGNQARGTGARGMVHALGGGETNQDLNNMEDDINA
nr:hypothetical protein [Tanacetum cinerariifolium]GEY76521.1 hypothetical protein [Tanacetum cinerariifolium]